MMSLVAFEPRLRRYAAFVVVGLVNTGVSYLAYMLLRPFIYYQAAYAVAFAVGTAISWIGNSSYVFSTPLSFWRFASFASSYTLSWAIGAGLLHAAVEWIRLPATIAPLLVIGMMMPVNYTLAKLALRRSDFRVGQHKGDADFPDRL
jgi:putative flippase GtrA